MVLGNPPNMQFGSDSGRGWPLSANLVGGP